MTSKYMLFSSVSLYCLSCGFAAFMAVYVNGILAVSGGTFQINFKIYRQQCMDVNVFGWTSTDIKKAQHL
jgi:hypothetical protein